MASSASAPGKALSEADLQPADLKIIMLGDSAVGKSKMVERFLCEEYNPRALSTYALTLFRHVAKEGDRTWNIDFWDTAGQEQFDHLHASYYFQANACILGFDVTRKMTYKNLDKWYKELRMHCPDIPVICVANKVDADPEIAKKKFNFPTTHQLPFFFVSAADGTNIVRVFKEAIRLAITNKEQPTDEVMAELWSLLQDTDSQERVGQSGFDEAAMPTGENGVAHSWPAVVAAA
mmetsp:Transcript_374/g.1284  ORF Transcript_374/g.1284 Transcript_374/m.1284 type:complete len:235 (+) Transcript_374:86-790(+)